MKILILADTNQQEELLSGKSKYIDSMLFDASSSAKELPECDALLILNDSWRSMNLKKTGTGQVIINSVTDTLKDLNLPDNVSRINAWPGFLQRKIWEVASKNFEMISEILNIIGKKAIPVKDQPGLVAPRVISMIINEAYFALGEEISTREEIDLAMKLGTNYPFGPFEWAEKIGLERIYKLLKKLSETDERYKPSPSLEKLFSENKD